MPKIPVTTFIDFVHSAGVKRISIVRGAKHEPYDPRNDFYKPFREALIEFHKGGGVDKQLLTDLPALQTDKKKRSAYPALISAYLRFVGKNPWVWGQTPPKLSWAAGDLTVKVNPELSVTLSGKSLLVKLWLRTDRLDRHKVATILLLMNQSAIATQIQLKPALLDVRRGKLYMPGTPAPGIDILLHGEAQAFSAMYRQL